MDIHTGEGLALCRVCRYHVGARTVHHNLRGGFTSVPMDVLQLGGYLQHGGKILAEVFGEVGEHQVGVDHFQVLGHHAVASVCAAKLLGVSAGFRIYDAVPHHAVAGHHIEGLVIHGMYGQQQGDGAVAPLRCLQ